MDNPDDPLVTRQLLSRMTGLSVTSVLKLQAKHDLEVVKIKGRSLVRVSAFLDAWRLDNPEQQTVVWRVLPAGADVVAGSRASQKIDAVMQRIESRLGPFARLLTDLLHEVREVRRLLGHEEVPGA